MRQTIGSTWLLQLMILFILLFVGFIILTLNYSKVIKVKNEVVSIIEKYEGLNENSISLVNRYLSTSGYATTGKCEEKEGVYGALTLDGDSLKKVDANSTYFYCVKKYQGQNTSKYYQVVLFYKFNLPVIGNASSYTVKGTTTNIVPSNEDDARDSMYCRTINENREYCVNCKTINGKKQCYSCTSYCTNK